MPCTTILVGKKASFDGSTLMARNEDAGSGNFMPKKFVVVQPDEQPKHYKSVISGVEIELPNNPMRYTSVPNAVDTVGIWGEAGFNTCNVAMSETETITSNASVQGADPLVPGGIGEEDMLTIVLPYIHSAREGVERLGMLLEQYGTYEMNGIGFQDIDDIWWLETIGGHHWIAKRVPDECYVVMPNQMGIDYFDLSDAYGEKKNHMCSADLIEFIESNHLDRMIDSTPLITRHKFDARAAFGSRDDSDHTYNTPRAWFMERYFNPNTYIWDGESAEYGPESDNIPWMLVPEKKISIEDIKYVLSSYYQGTEFNPYNKFGNERGKYRPIGINRNNFVALTQIRPYTASEIAAVEWLAMGSNAFNELVPFYANINRTPEYLSNTTADADTDNFYWVNRIIAALADAHFHECSYLIERYQKKLSNLGHQMLNGFDRAYSDENPEIISEFLEVCNDKLAATARTETNELLNKVLFEASNKMKNAFARSDA